jgi:hypothetical protein
MKTPINEKIAVTYLSEEGVKEYVVTHHPLKGKYTLYRIVNNTLQRMKIADTPIEFDELVEEDRSEI